MEQSESESIKLLSAAAKKHGIWLIGGAYPPSPRTERVRMNRSNRIHSRVVERRQGVRRFLLLSPGFSLRPS